MANRKFIAPTGMGNVIGRLVAQEMAENPQPRSIHLEMRVKEVKDDSAITNMVVETTGNSVDFAFMIFQYLSANPEAANLVGMMMAFSETNVIDPDELATKDILEQFPPSAV